MRLSQSPTALLMHQIVWVSIHIDRKVVIKLIFKMSCTKVLLTSHTNKALKFFRERNNLLGWRACILIPRIKLILTRNPNHRTRAVVIQIGHLSYSLL